MSTERVHVKLGISASFWDKRPEYRVSFNGETLARDQCKLDSGVTEYMTFDLSYTQDILIFEIELLNKQSSDTVESADKTAIIYDMLLNIDSLEIGDVDITPYLHTVSEYRPLYPVWITGDSVITDCTTLGWNGTWSITWTNPFYLWLLSKL